jgi:hypothetical protein
MVVAGVSSNEEALADQAASKNAAFISRLGLPDDSAGIGIKHHQYGPVRSPGRRRIQQKGLSIQVR